MEKEERILRPSLLSANFVSLKQDIDEMIELGIDDCHYDVMDGSFVEQISFGEPILKSIFKDYKDKIKFDVHLMTLNPYQNIRNFYDIGAREICFHYEVFDKNIDEIIKLKKECPDIELGIAFSPETNVEDVLPSVHLFSNVLVMSVVPGKGGQSYINGSEDKILKLYEFRNKNNLSFKIGVDGGINLNTAKIVFDNHVDWMVCGSYYFKSSDKKKLLKEFHEVIED